MWALGLGGTLCFEFKIRQIDRSSVLGHGDFEVHVLSIVDHVIDARRGRACERETPCMDAKLELSRGSRTYYLPEEEQVGRRGLRLPLELSVMATGDFRIRTTRL
jgi:hypothetical protein